MERFGFESSLHICKSILSTLHHLFYFITDYMQCASTNDPTGSVVGVGDGLLIAGQEYQSPKAVEGVYGLSWA